MTGRSSSSRLDLSSKPRASRLHSGGESSRADALLDGIFG